MLDNLSPASTSSVYFSFWHTLCRRTVSRKLSPVFFDVLMSPFSRSPHGIVVGDNVPSYTTTFSMIIWHYVHAAFQTTAYFISACRPTVVKWKRRLS